MKKRVSASKVMRVVSILGIVCLLALQWVWWGNAYRAVEVDMMSKSQECLKKATSDAVMKLYEEKSKGLNVESRLEGGMKKQTEKTIVSQTINRAEELTFIFEASNNYYHKYISAELVDSFFAIKSKEIFGFVPKHITRICRDSLLLDTTYKASFNRIVFGHKQDTIINQFGFKTYVLFIYQSPIQLVIKKGVVIFMLSMILVILLGSILILQFISMQRDRKFADFIIDYTRMITHDLRTPVSGVQMIFKMFQKEPKLEPEIKEKYLLEGENLSKKILLNLDNILYMAKSEQMELPVYLMEVDARTFVEKIVDGYRVRNYQPKVVRIETHYEPMDFKCSMDVGLMENAFCNLLENAIKFTNEDALIEVTCSRVENRITFKVKDNGMGMSAEDQKRVFAIFERGSANRNQQFPGFGIGLHFVERAVKAHGGKVTVQSEIRKGTEFTIRYTSSKSF